MCLHALVKRHPFFLASSIFLGGKWLARPWKGLTLNTIAHTSLTHPSMHRTCFQGPLSMNIGSDQRNEKLQRWCCSNIINSMALIFATWAANVPYAPANGCQNSSCEEWFAWYPSPRLSLSRENAAFSDTFCWGAKVMVFQCVYKDDMFAYGLTSVHDRVCVLPTS